MTHSGGKPHTNIGDKGQRYEVRAHGYPKEGRNTIGWSNSVDGAERLASGILLAPGCSSAEVFDRAEKKVIKEMRP